MRLLVCDAFSAVPQKNVRHSGKLTHRTVLAFPCFTELKRAPGNARLQLHSRTPTKARLRPVLWVAVPAPASRFHLVCVQVAPIPPTPQSHAYTQIHGCIRTCIYRHTYIYTHAYTRALNRMVVCGARTHVDDELQVGFEVQHHVHVCAGGSNACKKA
jgi:hypothetical protein